MRSDTERDILAALWFDITHKNTHTHTHTQTSHSGASRLTHPYKYMFTLPAMCPQELLSLD